MVTLTRRRPHFDPLALLIGLIILIVILVLIGWTLQQHGWVRS